MPVPVLDSDNVTEQQLAEWKSAGIISDFHGEYLNLSNQKGWKDDTLIVRNCPNLKTLYAPNLKLTAIDIDAPQLESLNLHGNRLTELELTKTENGAVVNRFPLLNSLTISENQKLAHLDPQRLPNLEELVCFKCSLYELDCSNLTLLKEIYCANQLFRKFVLKVQGCNNLAILDAAENFLCSLDLSNLTNLRDVSLKESGSLVYQELLRKLTIDHEKQQSELKRRIIQEQIDDLKAIPKQEVLLNISLKNCSSLEHLNLAKVAIGNLDVDGCFNLRTLIMGWLNHDFDLDENKKRRKEPALTKVLNGWEVKMRERTDEGKPKIELIPDSEYEAWMKRWKNGEINCAVRSKTKQVRPKRSYRRSPWYDPNFWKDSKRFPNLETIDIDNPKADEYEDPNYGPRIHAYQQQQKRDAFINGSVKTYQGQECLDLSGIGLTKAQMDGKLGFYPPSLKSINLGNNGLHTVEIKNFPNLEQLILSHNALTKPLLVLSNEEYGTLVESEGFVEVHQKYNLIVNCPKLKPQDLEVDSDIAIAQGLHKTLYGYKSDDPTRKSAEERVYDDKLDNPYQQKALVEDLLANPTNYTLPQIEQQLNFEQVPPMERGVLLELLKTKAEAQEEQAWAALCARFSLDKVEEEKQQLEQEEQQLKKEEEEAEAEAEATTSHLAQAKTEVQANIQQLLEENDLTASDLPPSYQQWEQQLQTCHSPEELQALQQQLYQAITEPTPVASSRHTVAWWGGLILSLFLVGYGLWRKLESDL